MTTFSEWIAGIGKEQIAIQLLKSGSREKWNEKRKLASSPRVGAFQRAIQCQ